MSKAQSSATQISPAPSSSEITLQLKRTFAAPRDRVFRAWTDPVEFARWFGPSADYSTVIPEFDLRVGGKYRLEMHHKGGNVNKLTGTYREIKPPEKVSFTWRWEADPTAHESLVTLEFRDLGASTELTVTHEQLANPEDRERHNQGWLGGLDQLAKYLQ